MNYIQSIYGYTPQTHNTTIKNKIQYTTPDEDPIIKRNNDILTHLKIKTT
jgi:hypothetical protein